MEPTVTWLMPVRDGMPYVRQTLAAVAAQRFAGTHALYAWDNGSTDGTVAELRRWVPGRIPGRVFAGRPMSIGASTARLVEAAPSELCARIDADDVPEPDRLARQVEFLARHPEVAAVGSAVTCIDPGGRVLHVPREPYHAGHDDIVHQLLYLCAIRQPSMTFRRSAVLAVGNYADLPMTEDYDLLLRLAARYRLANLPEPLLRYRHHPGSTSQRLRDFGRYHRDVRSRIFARHAPALFGLDEQTAHDLSCAELPCALPVLFAAVRHLERRNRIGYRARFASRSFQASARKLIARHDRLTHAFLRWATAGARHAHV